MTIPAYPAPHRPGLQPCPLDRIAHRRDDPAWLDAAWPSARLVPLWRYKVPVRGGRVVAWSAEQLGVSRDEAILLGEADGQVWFACDISQRDSTAGLDADFVDLRGALMRLPPNDCALLAYARAMIYWQRQHCFCGKCGGPLTTRQAGHVRHCHACDREHYPRSDPSMLTLVASGEHCLLGRQGGWPDKLYSVLAGFAEPGETIEDTVVREVWEEARVRVTGMRYVASQPWPFPASILFGFESEAIKEEPRTEQDELADARWFHVDELAQLVASAELYLPPPPSLSFFLIAQWFEGKTGKELPVALPPSRR